MKKSLKVLATTAIATISVLNGSAGFAASPLATIPSEQVSSNEMNLPSDSSNYMKFSGIISERKENQDSLTLVVENQDKSQMILHISDQTLLLNGKTTEEFQTRELVQGVSIEVYYDKTKPMIMIYPPRVTPEVVVVNDKGIGQVKISKFDENFVSLDNELKLHLDEKTVLVDEQGETIEKEGLLGKEWIVFYDVTTKSIPAQTAPKKIVALSDVKEQEAMEVENLIQEDHYTKDGTKMMPIRKVAEQLGYQVEWKQETKSVIVSKQNLSFQIAIGKKEYGFNRSVKYFEATPEIIDSKTYVPSEFLSVLKGKAN